MAAASAAASLFLSFVLTQRTNRADEMKANQQQGKKEREREGGRGRGRGGILMSPNISISHEKNKKKSARILGFPFSSYLK